MKVLDKRNAITWEEWPVRPAPLPLLLTVLRVVAGYRDCQPLASPARTRTLLVGYSHTIKFRINCDYCGLMAENAFNWFL